MARPPCPASTAPPWPVKATTAMRLADDPLRADLGHAAVTTTTHPAYRGATAHLREHAPALVAPFRDALPRAADTVGRRLVGALYREDLAPVGPGPAPGTPSTGSSWTAPAHPSPDVTDARPRRRADQRRGQPRPRVRPPGPADGRGRPRRRTRSTWNGSRSTGTTCTRAGGPGSAGTSPTCSRHDVEAGHTPVGFVAVRRDLVTGDDVGAALADAYPGVPAAPPGYVVQPVHAWQRDAVLHRRHADLYRDRRAARPRRHAARRAHRRAAHPAAAARPRRPAALPQGVPGHPGHLDPAHHLDRQHPQRPGALRPAGAGCSPTGRPRAAARRDRRRGR